MAADLEAEVQAIDKSLLECSAEEIAVVRRRARGGRARSAWGEEGAGAREAGTGLPGRRWGREGRTPFRGPGRGCARGRRGGGGEQAFGEGVSLPRLVIRAPRLAAASCSGLILPLSPASLLR